MSIETSAKRMGRGAPSRTSRIRRFAGLGLVGFVILASAGSAGAQSATSQLPITGNTPTIALESPRAAPSQAGPAVLGAQTVSSTTKAPAKVLGETLVAPAQISPAFTGSDVGGPVRLALMLGLAGTGIVLATRRRRSA